MNWEEIVQKYVIGQADKISKTTAPLKTHFGIEYFNYHRIDLEGRYTVLLNRPDWAEHYVEQKFYLFDPYLGHPANYKSGAYFFDSLGSADYKERIQKEADDYQLDSAIMLVERTQEAVEFFGFAANRNTSDIVKIYLNQPSILKSFATHFKNEMAPVLKKMQDEAARLPELTGRTFAPTSQLASQKDSYLSYLKEIGCEKEVRFAELLSGQEKKCLKALLNGLSAKETAQQLGGLSPRTVEFYLEKIKGKLGCWSKQELFKIAQKLHSLDLLP